MHACVFIFLCLGCVEGFAPVFQATSFLDSVQAIFAPKEQSSGTSNDAARREELKEALLEECQSGGNAKDKRARIETIIDKLSPLSPIADTAASPKLQREWALAFTTEKEINFFIDLPSFFLYVTFLLEN